MSEPDPQDGEEIELDEETSEMVLKRAEELQLSPNDYVGKLVKRDLSVARQERAIRLRSKRRK